MSQPRTLAEVLAATADVVLRHDAAEAPVGVNSRGSDGNSPLRVVVRRRDAEGAAILIAAGADVNAIGDMGEPPLHFAVRHQLWPLVELLVRAGARTDIVSEFGRTARQEALVWGGEEAVARLSTSG